MNRYLPSFVVENFNTFPRFESSLWKLLYGSDPFLSEQSNTNYPKYDIIKDKEDKTVFHIVMAVAGLNKENIKVTTLKNKLSIVYNKNETENNENSSEYIAHNISNREFKQMFTVPEGYEIQVISAKIADGLLSIDVKSIIPKDLEEKDIKIDF